MKPKPDLYGGGAERTDVAEEGLGIDVPRLAGSGALEFANVILLDRGRRTITAAGVRLGSDCG